MDKKVKKKLMFCLSGLVVGGYGMYKGFINKEPLKYSLAWIKDLTDSEWDTEREIVRQMFCSPKYDDSLSIKFQNILYLFDKVKNERDWEGKKPQGPAFHREHGWYL